MSNLLENLNPEQTEAVSHEAGPLLIVAGAGTGKTSVITTRIAYLILEKKCRPDEILALTFTDKAAGEMEERVDRLMPYGYVDLWISTFHAFGERMLKTHGLEIGLPNDFKLLSTTDQWLLVRQNLDRFNLDYYRPLGNPTKFIHALIRHFSRAKDENISAKDYLDYVAELKMNTDSAEFVRTVIDEEMAKDMPKAELKEILAQEIIKQEEVANAFHIYQQILLENNALDFGDLINYTLKLFKERKNILAKYRVQFKYILVDEFQDTNLAQYELIKMLAAPKNNITVVGDDDQSIYKFRGASISNILHFKEDYPEAKQIFLVRNYRSRQNLLDLAYRFVQQNNPYRLEVKLGDNLSKRLLAQKEGGAELVHLHGQSLADEVKLTVEKIINLYNQDPNPNWSDFAILVRANSGADDFCYALGQADIPYQFVASKGLYRQGIVLDILAYLKLLDNYHESAAMYRVLGLACWNIAQADLIALNHFANRRGFSLYETILQIETLGSQISTDTAEKIKTIIAMLERHSQLTRENKKTTALVQAFLTESGLLKELTTGDSREKREQINYLNQFYKKIENFEKEASSSGLKNFLALVELELESGEEGSLSTNWEEESPDTVKVMTIHAAKGLEFKYVFIANLVDKRFPSISKSEPIDLPEKLVKEITPEGDVHLMEERRLFYVAMTRAKEGLYFSSAEDYGGARSKKLSRFLIELGGLEFPLSEKAKAKGVNLSALPEEPKTKRAVSAPAFILPDKFSFTQLKAFETCPYQYRFAHVLRVPTKGKAQFSFGKSMHGALQKFFQALADKKANQQAGLFDQNVSELPKMAWEELLRFYEESFVDDWYESRPQKEEWFEKGKKALKEFFDKCEVDWPSVKFLEYEFNLKINSYTIFGRIDRIDQAPDGVKIVDYKTGKPKTNLTLDEKEQLLIYQMAAEQVMAEKVIGLSFYYLDVNEELNFLGQEKDLLKIKEKIMATIEAISHGEFPAKPEQEKCKWCDFKDICDYRA